MADRAPDFPAAQPDGRLYNAALCLTAEGTFVNSTTGCRGNYGAVAPSHIARAISLFLNEFS